jgi:hypothetical protein
MPDRENVLRYAETIERLNIKFVFPHGALSFFPLLLQIAFFATGTGCKKHILIIKRTIAWL